MAWHDLCHPRVQLSCVCLSFSSWNLTLWSITDYTEEGRNIEYRLVICIYNFSTAYLFLLYQYSFVDCKIVHCPKKCIRWRNAIYKRYSVLWLALFFSEHSSMEEGTSTTNFSWNIFLVIRKFRKKFESVDIFVTSVYRILQYTIINFKSVCEKLISKNGESSSCNRHWPWHDILVRWSVATWKSGDYREWPGK